ncbi:hypothetical protein [Phormidium tenue]|uniref:hypothetical protein n=1 Tax=Phormidium tenue TaxID=126344 RepID=UPI0015C538B1|nr:hypothetical protein [Phormidium tenue]MBD2230109.1 hypothetical protein [Phormidium tenue FACHB-1052]
MVQALNPSAMSFEEFIQWIPENGGQYELYSGYVVETQPTGSLSHQSRKRITDP